MWDLSIEYKGTTYPVSYNAQSGYYEIELQADSTGGIYPIDITYEDIFDDEYTLTYDLQVFAKKPIVLDIPKVFMWIFDYRSSNSLDVKDIVEISDYEIVIDEETNAKSKISCLKNTGAKANDIIAVKKNNEVVYWGIVDEIQNEDGEIKYTFITRNLTNLFDRKIQLTNTKRNFSQYSKSGLFTIRVSYSGTNYYFELISSLGMKTAINDYCYFYFEKYGNYFILRSAKTGQYLKSALLNGRYIIVGTNTFTGADEELWTLTDVGITTKALPLYSTYYYENQELVILSSEESNLSNYSYTTYVQYTIMQKMGLEDYIKETILKNFTKTNDTLINLDWLDINTLTHTPKSIQVTNVTDGIYNLHTWITNCNQMYNVTYDFDIVQRNGNWNLQMKIETYVNPKELIDTNAQNISNYTEVFETNVLAKVIVVYSKVNGQANAGTYTLYLKTDRTTTTNISDPNRAEGDITTIYTENYEEANQKALDSMKANEYNHNITFNYDKYVKIGTPIAIKTKKSLIYNTYISQVKITPKGFYEYICGNIRINFIDKLKKEKTNA